MSCAFPPITPPLPDTIPTPAPQSRSDGWSPARQRHFLEILAATGVILAACEGVGITARSAYSLRIRPDGAAFRLGWDAAILIARTRLADDLLARAMLGSEEVIRKDGDTGEIRRHRHDNRLAMSMLARLDRMADSPPEGSDAALARIVAQDFAAYLDLLCPPDPASPMTHAPTDAPADAHIDAQARAQPGTQAAALADPIALPHDDDAPGDTIIAAAGPCDGTPADPPDPAIERVAPILAPAASVALFIAARLALRSGAQLPADPPLPPAANPRVSAADERCELRPPLVDLMTLPPDEAAARLQGIWWDDDRDGWRTDYPAPPGFDGDQSEDYYEINQYERDLTDAEALAHAQQLEAESRPYEAAAARARDTFFGFSPDAQGLSASFFPDGPVPDRAPAPDLAPYPFYAP